VLLNMKDNNSIVINLWRHGLGVRMYLIVSYLAYARDQGKSLTGLWKNNQQCPGNFCDIFEPIDGCQILDNNWKGLSSSLPKGPKALHMLEGYLPRDHPNLYSVFEPTKNIQLKIDSLCSSLGPFISIHARRTDHVHVMKKHNTHVSDQDFFDFIDLLDGSLKIFLACDNKDTQKVFLDRYGPRVVFNKNITNDFNPHYSLVRATSLEDAVVDMFVSSQALYFKGSNKTPNGIGPASFSSAIQYLYNLNQKT
jgi:hypothetical protein